MAEEIQYQSLYRKYRPQTPDEVIGQDHVVRALVGAVREGRLAHAFLFTGPRGTGKTSTARILAKMVNCEKGPTPEPCGVCEQCVRIRDGSHLDVVEIDAASHGGVDDARELRERAPTAPAQGREKVYILDEAQRLSREAFDALLKLFEEPPQGVRFVLCTTEPHKMPPTIAGRCQRFDFRRIAGEPLSDLLQKIAAQEGWSVTSAAAEAIARQAEGSARDAESLLDQAAVLSAGEITEEVLESLLGQPSAELRYALADAVAVGDTNAVFGVIHQLVQEGQDLRHFTAEALGHFRNLLLAQSAPGQADLIDVPADEYERLRAQAAKLQPAELARVIALLLAAQTDMRWTTSPRLTLELGLVRATIPESDPAPEGLVSRLERLERLAGFDLGGAAAVSPALARPLPQLEQTASSVQEPSLKLRRGSPPPGSAAAGTDPLPTSGPAGADSPPGSAAAGAGTEAPSGSAAADTSASKAPTAAEDAPPSTAAPSESAASPPTAGSVDVEMLRRSWTAIVDRLRTKRMALGAMLERGTVGAFDGETLEVVFPPGWTSNAQRVANQQADVAEALAELFGIRPKLRCVVREAAVVEVELEEEPLTEEAALARLKEELGAEIAAEPEARS